MATIGLIGAGHIGSQVARLAVKSGYDVVMSNSRGPETLSALVKSSGPGTGGHAGRGGDGGRDRGRHRPAQELPRGAGRSAGRQDRDRHQQLLPATRWAHPGARRRDHDDVRAAAGAPAEVESREGLQPHLRGRADDARSAGGHAEPPRAGDRGRRPEAKKRSRGCWTVRLRHGRRRPAEGGLADPARHPATGRGATRRSWGATWLRRSVTRT